MITYRLALVVLSLTIQVSPRVLDKPLTLEANIETQRYCAIQDGTSTLLIKFNVRLLNHGKSSIVIDRPIYPLLLVSRTQSSRFAPGIALRAGCGQGEIEGTESFVRATSPPIKIVVLKRPELENCQ